MVAWPRHAEDVAASLAWAKAEGVVVVPYGAGSGVCGSAMGRAGSLVLDLKRLDHLGPVDPVTRTVRVGPGMLGQHLEDRLARLGWQTGHSPSSIGCSTVGGWAAARSAGQFSSRYGVFDDILLAAELETPAGRLRCGDWTAPGEEDLLPILCGSEGGLGVFTDTLLRVAPTPAVRRLRGFAFPSLTAAWEAMRAMLQAELWPVVLRLYDPVDTRIGGRIHPPKHRQEAEGARRGRAALQRIRDRVRRTPALQRHLLDLPLALPGLLNRIAGELGQEVLLITGFEGDEALVDRQWRAAAPLLAAARDLGTEPGERWYQHRHDVSYKLAPIFSMGSFADTMEVACPWSKLGALYAGVREAIGRHALVMAHFSHAYPEGCSIYFSFVGAGRTAVYDALWSEALAAAAAAGGTVTHHHGVGPLKAAAAAKEAGAALRVWSEVKRALDPTGIMNPGRPYPAEPVSDEPGPSPPVGGPVYALSAEDRMADVDPDAPVEAIEAALSAAGFALRFRPDRPLGAWLRALRRSSLNPWEAPLFGLQARFPDGASVRLGPAPRSAAGPDLRPALLRRAKVELVQVPLRSATAVAVTPPEGLDPRDLRPAWATADQWGFVGDAAETLAALGTAPAAPRCPTRAPRSEP